MLVLTRKAADKIHIGGEITVTILRIQGRAVKVGIEAPGHVRVLRDSLLPVLEGTLVTDAADRTPIGVSRQCRKPR
jgi:carbon storage regulator CsrA